VQILVVAGEERLLLFLARALRAAGMRVSVAPSGREAAARDYDLVVLDVMTREPDGLEVVADLQRRKPGRPVVVLSALSDLETRLRAFSLGASDFLARPFSLDELLARVRVHAGRHNGGADGQVLHAGRLDLDVARREARFGGRTSELTDGEFRLLHDLAEHAGEVLSREQLLADVWGYEFEAHSNVVDVGIRRLRRKLGPGAPIESVRNVGYRLVSAS